MTSPASPRTSAVDSTADLQDVPLLSRDELERAEPAIASLCTALDAFGYSRFAQLPTGRSRMMLLREPLTLFHALRGTRTQLFTTSAFPSLYRSLLTREAATLVSLAFYGDPLPRKLLIAILGRECVDALCASRVLVSIGERLVSLLRVTPLDGSYVVSDRVDHRRSGVEPVWLGADSLNLVSHLRRELTGVRVDTALDLCSGSGVQAFTMASHARNVTGVDLNPRAVAMARLNARLRSLSDVAFVCGDLADVLDENRYDLIVGNPPFVAMPEDEREGFMDGYGGPMGLDVVDRILERLPGSLQPGGRAYLRVTSPVVRGENMLTARLRRLADERGCGVHVTPFTYLLDPKFAAHQVAIGVEHFVAQIIRITHDGSAQLRIDRMPRLRAWVTGSRARRIRRATLTRARC